MRILIAIALLAGLALLVSSRRLWAWRRSRLGAMLTTGGWLAVVVGLLLGPRGLGAVRTEQVMVVQPLIAFFLGWVGLLIGMQVRKDLPRMLPSGTLRMVVLDLAVTAGGMAVLAWGVLHLIAPDAEPLPRIVIAMLIASVAVGWSSEVRSLRNRRRSDPAAGVLRATAGVSSVAAIVLYGVLFMLIEHVPPVEAVTGQDVVAATEDVITPDEPIDPEGTAVEPSESRPESVPADSATASATTEGAQSAEAPVRRLDRLDLSVAPLPIGLGLSIAVALVSGVLALWLTRLAGRNESQFLVVLLALVALLAGAATTLGYSPLFVALLGGVVAVNLPGRALVRMQQVILDAEQPIAMGVMVVAGVLADPMLPPGVWALVLALLGGRALLKLPVGRLITRRSTERRHALGTIRQNPIAIALVVGYAISGHAPLTDAVLTGGQLVMAVVIVGLLSDMLPLLFHWLLERRGERGGGSESEVEVTDGSVTTRRPAEPIREDAPPRGAPEATEGGPG